MNNVELAQLLFQDDLQSLAELEKTYPKRTLKDGAKVTRMAPSPTGFMHLGNLYGAIADERLAHQSGGVFFLRIEDTDKKREVAGGVQTIIDAFDVYELPFDEGEMPEGAKGAYGPYRQRQREDIYKTCARELLLQGKAYPCFLTENQLANMREEQVQKKEDFGCYGQYAVYRDSDIAEIRELIVQGKPYTLRYRSEGKPENRIKVSDLVRGTIELPENTQDVVLLKANGIPTYHFAHVVDDYFMRTTHVVRGEEWLATLPMHVQLFGAMGWRAPKYLHTAHLMKMDGGSKRKLSKRKDPELALSFYSEKGYSVAAVKEYLMLLLNSNFEDWRMANPSCSLNDFKFSIKKMGVSGALFDIDKLNDVSKTVVSKLTAEEVYEALLAWAKLYDKEFAALIETDAEYAKKAFIIGRECAKPRKDITVWQQAKEYFSFYFEELFAPEYSLPENVTKEKAKQILNAYVKLYDENDDANSWFNKVKQLTDEVGFASNMKEYKKNPASFVGSVADVSMVIRLAVCGRAQSPDLCEIMQVLGAKTVCARLLRMAEKV